MTWLKDAHDAGMRAAGEIEWGILSWVEMMEARHKAYLRGVLEAVPAEMWSCAYDRGCSGDTWDSAAFLSFLFGTEATVNETPDTTMGGFQGKLWVAIGKDWRCFCIVPPVTLYQPNDVLCSGIKD